MKRITGSACVWPVNMFWMEVRSGCCFTVFSLTSLLKLNVQYISIFYQVTFTSMSPQLCAPPTALPFSDIHTYCIFQCLLRPSTFPQQFRCNGISWWMWRQCWYPLCTASFLLFPLLLLLPCQFRWDRVPFRIRTWYESLPGFLPTYRFWEKWHHICHFMCASVCVCVSGFSAFGVNVVCNIV